MAWVTDTATLPGLVQGAMTVEYGGYVYLIGGNVNGTWTANVYSALINSDGSIGAWTQQTSFPELVVLGSAVVYNGYVYILGGYYNQNSDSTTSYIAYAQLNNGTISSWTGTSTFLPYSPAQAGAVVVGGYAFIIGGFDPSTSPGPYATVWSAPITPGGSTGTWTQQASLPVTYYGGAVVTDGTSIYVIGGEQNGAAATAAYTATPNGGTISSWTTQSTNLPEITTFQLGVFAGGHIYIVGGRTTGGNDTANVYQASASGGVIGAWISGTPLPVPNALAAQPGFVYNNTTYVLGGSNKAAGVNYTNTIYYTSLASAPNAPTLTTPANGAYLDVTISGNDQFTGTYNSTDGANANARAFRIKASTASSYNYLNVSTNALQSTIVWNTVNIAPGASGTFTVLGLANGVTDNWSMADQETLANLQGPFASDFSVNFQLAPNLSINQPVGSVTISNSPSLAYTPTPASGASVTGGRWLIYPLSVTQASGFSIDIGAGTIPTGAVSDVSWTGNPLTVAIQSGVTLTNGSGYVAYAAITETGSEWSSTISSSFTISLDQPATPTITAVASIDTATTPPLVTVTVQGHDNILSADDASFEGSIGTWGPQRNCAAAQSSTVARDGAHSLLLTSVASGLMAASTALHSYAVVENETYTAIAFLRAASTSENVTLFFEFYDSSGTYISSLSSSSNDSSSAWAPIVVSGISPANAALADLKVQVNSTSAAGEEHYVDTCGIFPGNLGYELEVLSDNPVAYWPLSDGAGSTSVVDVTGNGNTGTVNGGVTLGEPGVVAQFPNETSAYFDGSGYIQDLTTALASTAQFTAEVWASTTSSGGAQAAMSLGIPASWPSGLFIMYIGDDFDAYLEDSNNIGGRIGTAATTTAPDDGKMHHYVITVNGTTLSYYMDGVFLNSVAMSGMTAFAPTSNDLAASNDNGSPTQWFPGYLAHAAIYPSALSAARIQAHYNAALATGSFVEKWSRGGLVGSTQATVVRSDGFILRQSPTTISVPSQEAVFTDYEAPGGFSTTYTATVSVEV